MTARLIGAGRPTPFVELKAGILQRYVSVRGTVIRVSAAKPVVRKLPFVCGRCGSETTVILEDGKYQLPSVCSDPTCKSRAFQGIYALAEAVDVQRIRLQVGNCPFVSINDRACAGVPSSQNFFAALCKAAQSLTLSAPYHASSSSMPAQESDLTDSETVPKTVEVELSEDLVDSCVPGELARREVRCCIMIVAFFSFARAPCHTFPYLFFVCHCCRRRGDAERRTQGSGDRRVQGKRHGAGQARVPPLPGRPVGAEPHTQRNGPAVASDGCGTGALCRRGGAGRGAGRV